VSQASVGELREEIEGALRCFRCKGILAWRGDELACAACGSRFAAIGNLIDHRPSSKPDKAAAQGANSGRYGSWFREGATSYEETHNLTTTYSNWIAGRAKTPLARHSPLPARLVLEIGCGTGVHTRGWLNQELAQFILATDISPEMLAEAVKGTPSSRVAFFVRDVHDLNLANESVDVVAGGSILHHLLDLRLCLAEIARVLKPGGSALFMEPFYAGNRMLGFMMRLLLGEMRRHERHRSSRLQALDALVDSWIGNIEYRHQYRGNLEKLAPMDDKHLFTREDIHRMSREAGFREVEIASVYEDFGPGREYVMREIALDILASLAKEGRIAPLEPDQASVDALGAISCTYAEFFLAEHGSSEFCIFVK
jgi:ubiquinone/menaquinone biosynthesis C-methylase UbiE